MRPMDILAECQKAGVLLDMDTKGGLTVQGDRDEVALLLPSIRRHKPELLDLLTGKSSATTDEASKPDTIGCDDTKRGGPFVTVYTPAGAAMTVQAKDADHAEWLKRMNPPKTAL